MKEELKKEAFECAVAHEMSTEKMYEFIDRAYEAGQKSNPIYQEIFDEGESRGKRLERKRIITALKDNWTRLMGAYMVGSMQGNLDEQWEKVFNALERGGQV